MSNKKRITFSICIIFLLTFCITPNIYAQQKPETERIDDLRDMLKNDYFNLSMLIQPKFDFAFDENGTRGFNVTQARFKGDGKLDGGFSYKLHFDVADSFTLLDAEIGYALSEDATIIVGAQKPGISYEFLTGPNKIDFVSRSYIVSALTQNRDFGVKLTGSLSDVFNYTVGMYNGNRLNANDNNKFYYVGRLGYSSNTDNGTLIAGVNASYGEQSNTRIANGSLPNIDGERIIYGGDIRYENNRLILASELLGASLEYLNFTDTHHVFGLHITGGYKFTDRSRALIRFENLDSEQFGVFLNQERLVFGFTHYPTSQTAFRINYLLPTDDTSIENHGLALNYQLEF